MGKKTIQETPADSKHNNPKLSPSENITGTPAVRAFELLHSGGQSSLNSFQAGGREQQPSALSPGTEPSTRAWVPGTARGGVVSAARSALAACPWLQVPRAAPRHSQCLPTGVLCRAHEQWEHQSLGARACEANAQVARLALLPGETFLCSSSGSTCSAETHKGFFHLPSSLSNQLWLERQRLHCITF